MRTSRRQVHQAVPVHSIGREARIGEAPGDAWGRRRRRCSENLNLGLLNAVLLDEIVEYLGIRRSQPDTPV